MLVALEICHNTIGSVSLISHRMVHGLPMAKSNGILTLEFGRLFKLLAHVVQLDHLLIFFEG